MIAPIVGADQIPSGAVRIDVRWTLDGGTDQAGFVAGHLPGARFVDFDEVCVGPGPAIAGRHPLASPERFAEGLGAASVTDDTTVVAYDGGAALAAARLVWMLRTIGQDAALLDGGLAAWPGRLEVGDPPVETVSSPGRAVARRRHGGRRHRGHGRPRRPPRRLRQPGPRPLPRRTASLDTRAGHVPGAASLPYADNLGADGRFLDPLELRLRFRAAGADDESIYYCGSGVSACINALAAEHAGIGQPGRIYVGSWSGGPPRDAGPDGDHRRRTHRLTSPAGRGRAGVTASRTPPRPAATDRRTV